VDWEVTQYPAYWADKKLAYPHVPAEAPKLSKSVVVGNLVFLSGASGRSVETGTVTSNVLEDQMVVALGRMKAAMEEAGSSLDNIIKTIMLLKDVRDYPRMRKTELEYYQKHAPFLVDNPPASTFIQPAALASSEYLIEIDAVGVISRDKPGWEVTQYPEYWAGKKLAYPHVPAEAPHFSRSAVAGNLIFHASVGRDMKSGEVASNVLEDQMVVTLDGVRNAMEEAGSSLNNVIKTIMLLRDVRDYPRMRKAELEYYQKHAPFLVDNPPASTFIQPAALASPEYLVEIDVVAVVSR